MSSVRFSCCFILLYLFCSCSSAVKFKKLQNSNEPFKRPTYSIMPPKGTDWYYSDKFKPVGPFHHENQLVFAKETSSPPHMLNFVVEEFDVLQNENYTPLDFFNDVNINHLQSEYRSLNFLKKPGITTNQYKNCLNVIENETKLDKTFGDYCVRFYYHAINQCPNKILNDKYLNICKVIKLYGYLFYQLSKNTVVHVYYIEAGEEAQIDPNFTKTAQETIKGLTLK